MRKLLILSSLFSSFLFSDENVSQVKEAEIIPFRDTFGSSLIVIKPKERAKDFIEAFEILKKEKANNKIFVKLSDGSLLSPIQEMSSLEKGTLILVKLNSQIRFVLIEDIIEIGLN